MQTLRTSLFVTIATITLAKFKWNQSVHVFTLTTWSYCYRDIMRTVYSKCSKWCPFTRTNAQSRFVLDSTPVCEQHRCWQLFALFLACCYTWPYNMVNFGPLAAEIVSLVWGTPGYLNGFRVLAALLHCTLVVGVSQTCGVEQRAPSIFSRAAITLGIGQHF